jgi:crossover junction endodeoxyribonuclease RuvC
VNFRYINPLAKFIDREKLDLSQFGPKKPRKKVYKLIKAVDKTVDPVEKLVKRNFTPEPSKKPRPLILGVDPGLSGALCLVDLDSMNIIDMIDIPTYQKPTQARVQGYFEMVDVHKLSSLIDMYAPLISLAVLEEPGAMPEQGLSSTFRFGHVCGMIHGVLAGHYIPVVPVKPAVWKTAMNLTHVKKESLTRASIEYPNFSDLWRLMKHNDRAEAALMCVYGKKYLSQMINLSRK